MKTVKSYTLTSHENPGKTLALQEMIKQQQEYLLEDSCWAEEEFLRAGRIPRWRPDSKALPGMAVMRRNSWNQVRGAYNSYRARIIEEGRRLIETLALEEDLRKELYALNKFGAWKDPSGFKWAPSPEALGWAEVIFEELTTRFLPPVVGARPSVILSNGILFTDSRETSFGHWVEVPSTQPRKPVRVPLSSNSYWEASSGEKPSSVRISLEDDGQVTFSFPRKEEVEPYRVIKKDCLGLDWGLVNLFTTSDGRRLGTHAWKHLRELDKRLTELDARLQKLGVSRKTNRRFQRLQRRISSLVENEVGRILNALAAEGWETWAVEKLDFRGKSFSRRMNRLLTRAGRGAVTRKLAALKERGLSAVEVNPAYTSQECPSCGFVSRSNRPSQKSFSCQFCGKRSHADVTGAQVVKKRLLERKTWAFTPREKVRDLLDSEFEARWGLSLRAWEASRIQRACSSAPANEGSEAVGDLVPRRRVQRAKLVECHTLS